MRKVRPRVAPFFHYMQDMQALLACADIAPDNQEVLGDYGAFYSIPQGDPGRNRHSGTGRWGQKNSRCQAAATNIEALQEESALRFG